MTTVIKSIGNFFLNQILGMQWLNDVVGAVLSSLGIDTDSRTGGSIRFFL